MGEVSASASISDATDTLKTWTLHVGESFPDVPTSNQFYPFIENIYHHGVTGGCSAPPNYCPGDFTLRKQMAVFVLKAMEGLAYVPPPATGIFTDVPQADPFAPWIEELYNRGVVAGCGAGPAYCPNNPVLRQQMAIFLLKTLLDVGVHPAGRGGDVRRRADLEPVRAVDRGPVQPRHRGRLRRRKLLPDQLDHARRRWRPSWSRASA